jgi:peptidoglycan/xylan/chitin deacetylase (PgdA/CDA1 family)
MVNRGRSLLPASSLTRRGLLGALGLVVLGGAADALHLLTRRVGSTTVGAPRGLPARVAALLEGNLDAPHGLPTASPASPSPTASRARTQPRQAPAHAHSHQPVEAGHDHLSKRARMEARDQHVTLPPPQLKVRNEPAYRLSQLISNPPQGAIALTIDDGPDPRYTPKVLRLLDEYDTPASFCVVGVHADADPGLIRDIAAAGHILVNHSYTHMLPFNQLPEKRIVSEITKTQRSIEKAAKVTPQLFRAPGGDWSHFIFRALASYGLEPLDWDVDPRDWAMPGAKKIAQRMLLAKPGEIVLCHDGGGNRVETVRALRTVLPTWQNQGLMTIPLQINPSHYLSGG